MSDRVMRSFDASRDNPFQLNSIRCAFTLEEATSIPGPKVYSVCCVVMLRVCVQRGSR